MNAYSGMWARKCSGLLLAAAGVLGLMQAAPAVAACQEGTDYQTVDYFKPPASSYNQYVNQGGYPWSLCQTDSGLPGGVDRLPRCLLIDLKGALYLPHPLISYTLVSPLFNTTNVNTLDHDMPLVVFVDGSARNDADPTVRNPTYTVNCPQGQYFAGKGYVMLSIARRGYGQSTGTNADVRSAVLSQNGVNGAANFQDYVDYVANQDFEVQEAINFMLTRTNAAGQRLINPDKIGVVGHSIGALLLLFFGNEGNKQPIIDAGRPSGHTQAKAKVLFSPVSQSWDGYDQEKDYTFDIGVMDDASVTLGILQTAASHSALPAYYLEAINDQSPRPIVDLAKHAGDWNLGVDNGDGTGTGNRGCRLAIRADSSLSFKQQTRKIVDTCPRPREYQSALFPAATLRPVTDVDSNGDPLDDSGHIPFIANESGVWGPSVVDFLARYGVK